MLDELFRLDQPDLNSDIYRLLYARSILITEFLHESLPGIIQKALDENSDGNKTHIFNHVYCFFRHCFPLRINDDDCNINSYRPGQNWYYMGEIKTLCKYTRQNGTDHFIHRYSERVLRGKLDFYIKDQVMQLDDIETADILQLKVVFAEIRAIRHISRPIIDVLVQFEEFQKQLWLKPKSVIDIQYCITLNYIPREFYSEIIANEAQREQWVELFHINEIKGYSKPLDNKFLQSNNRLPVDTGLYNENFKDRLLAHIGNIDNILDGRLFNGDNFQVLSILREEYENSIDCIYIDPPYNTDASIIDYKNNWKSSSWTIMMENRIQHCIDLLKETGVLMAAIDDAQYCELNDILKNTFDRILGTFVIRSNPSGRPTKTGYSISHEYMIAAGKTRKSSIGRMPATLKQQSRFNHLDENGPFEWRNLRREGSNSNRAARPRLFYPIYISEKTVRVPEMLWLEERNEWDISEQPVSGETVVYPLNDAGDEKTWRWKSETVKASMHMLGVRKNRQGRNYPYYKRRPNQNGVVSVSTWTDARYSASEHGTRLLGNLFGKKSFTYPKSIHAVTDAVYIGGGDSPNSTILDFFAGSGTTAHAVIDLNRRDNGNRKYILVEQAEYFNTVLKPRIMKVAYASDWRDGKPVSHDMAISHAFSYSRLDISDNY